MGVETFFASGATPGVLRRRAFDGVARHALLAPVEALVTEKAGASVFTVVDNKAKKIPIKTGFNDGTNVEVVSGLEPAQTVILIGKRALSEGQAVQVGEAK